MELLLCCLLHLALIFSPGSYYTSEIETLEQNNLYEINLIRNDPTSAQQVMNEHSSELEFINIFDDSEM